MIPLYIFQQKDREDRIDIYVNNKSGFGMFTSEGMGVIHKCVHRSLFFCKQLTKQDIINFYKERGWRRITLKEIKNVKM